MGEKVWGWVLELKPEIGGQALFRVGGNWWQRRGCKGYGESKKKGERSVGEEGGDKKPHRFFLLENDIGKPHSVLIKTWTLKSKNAY